LTSLTCNVVAQENSLKINPTGPLNVPLLYEVIKVKDGENHGILPVRYLLNKAKDIKATEGLLALNKTILLDIKICTQSLATCVNPAIESPKYIYLTPNNALMAVEFLDGEMVVVEPRSEFEKIIIEAANKRDGIEYLFYLRKLYSIELKQIDLNSIFEYDFASFLTGADSVNGPIVISQNSSYLDPTTPDGPGEHDIEYCGSEASASFVPEWFPKSCKAHDECYSSGEEKTVCDLGFRDAMNAEASDMTLVNPQFALLMFNMVNTYYSAVTNESPTEWIDDSFDAFCNATTNPAEHAECDDEVGETVEYAGSGNADLPEGAVFTGGYGMGLFPVDGIYSGGLNNSGTLRYSCEIWEFPDGNGGKYYMLKKCVRI